MYMSTLAPVVSATMLCQVGNGSRKAQPAMNARIMLAQGTPRRSVRWKICGRYRFLDSA